MSNTQNHPPPASAHHWIPYLIRNQARDSSRDSAISKSSSQPKSSKSSRNPSISPPSQSHHSSSLSSGSSRTSSPGTVMAARARPNGRIVSGMVQGLEDDNRQLEVENTRLQEEIARLRVEAANLRKEVTDIEAERDDYVKVCAQERSKQEDVRNMIYAQVKAEFDQLHQVLDILHSNMDHDTWFSIIDSRENAYHSRVQKQQLALRVKEKEIEELRKANRQKETEMAVLRSWIPEDFLQQTSVDVCMKVPNLIEIPKSANEMGVESGMPAARVEFDLLS